VECNQDQSDGSRTSVHPAVSDTPTGECDAVSTRWSHRIASVIAANPGEAGDDPGTGFPANTDYGNQFVPMSPTNPVALEQHI